MTRPAAAAGIPALVRVGHCQTIPSPHPPGGPNVAPTVPAGYDENPVPERRCHPKEDTAANHAGCAVPNAPAVRPPGPRPACGPEPATRAETARRDPLKSRARSPELREPLGVAVNLHVSAT
ncbi:hypothetical protein GCM10010403_26960 [Glycomyces rutgersensis]|uniref:Uncharacterized protein n=1 Tax=Glycomyces rutgersensis TaxID=58115 RepID=A0ABN3FMQ0_9ACTN